MGAEPTSRAEDVLTAAQGAATSGTTPEPVTTTTTIPTAEVPPAGAALEEAVPGPARRVFDAVLAVDGVHRLGSRADRIASGVRTGAGAADKVPGVRIDRTVDPVVVRVTAVAEYPVEVHELADRVRDAATAALPADLAGARVDVVVADVHGPFDREPEPEDETPEESDAAAPVPSMPDAASPAVDVAEDVPVREVAVPATPETAPVAAREPDDAAPVRIDGTGAEGASDGSGR